MRIRLTLADTAPTATPFREQLEAKLAQAFPGSSLEVTWSPTFDVAEAEMEGRPDAEGPILEAVEAALAAYRGPAFDEVTLRLPWEFAELCRACLVSPELVLRGFIADLCGLQCSQAHPRADGYTSNGSDERRLAQEYFARCGYASLVGL